MQILMIFIDGFGLGVRDKNNPYFYACTPFLDALLGGHVLYRDNGIIHKQNAVMIPTDALLGVEGIPQSATGQTTIWTGVNAARIAGKHINAYPTPVLKQIINKQSIMKVLADNGKKVTFANAYRPEYFEQVKLRKAFHSTSTLVTLSSGVELRSLKDLQSGNAVYQDFTNSLLAEWGYAVSIISPKKAGSNLVRVAKQYDFTLYEYFISDRIGHKRDMSSAITVYEELDGMLGACYRAADLTEMLILIVSDHGNIEDLSKKSHTRNPVPTIIINQGYNNTGYEAISSLTDITPFVLNNFGMKSTDAYNHLDKYVEEVD